MLDLETLANTGVRQRHTDEAAARQSSRRFDLEEAWEEQVMTCPYHQLDSKEVHSSQSWPMTWWFLGYLI